MIGIVGGIGPYAGKDLLEKIFNNTVAYSDQDYVDVALLSLSSKIKDRTEYLLGHIDENPAYAIVKVILKLESIGAKVIGMPCNTAHSKPIFDIILNELNNAKSKVKVLNMIDETVNFITSEHPQIKKVGVLSTTGTYKSKLYKNVLEKQQLTTILPTLNMQEKLVHPAIYDSEYGIKTVSNPIHPQALKNLKECAQFLKSQGAEALIYGCTEIPLVFKNATLENIVAIDPTDVLARALIKVFLPEKLRVIAS